MCHFVLWFKLKTIVTTEIKARGIILHLCFIPKTDFKSVNSIRNFYTLTKFSHVKNSHQNYVKFQCCKTITIRVILLTKHIGRFVIYCKNLEGFRIWINKSDRRFSVCAMFKAKKSNFYAQFWDNSVSKQLDLGLFLFHSLSPQKRLDENRNYWRPI